MTDVDYEVVYSAALERQGRGLSLSGHRGPSTLEAFDAIDRLAHNDVIEMYKKAQKVQFPHWRRQNRTRHRFRSRNAA